MAVKIPKPGFMHACMVFELKSMKHDFFISAATRKCKPVQVKSNTG